MLEILGELCTLLLDCFWGLKLKIDDPLVAMMNRSSCEKGSR